ncbi:MAG: GFA family protein [Hyphomicrobiales bacterium]
MAAGKNHKGRCFCGAVEFTVTGDPVMMGYCHCGDCRLWSAGPINAFTIWQPDQFKVTKGAEKIGMYAKTDKTHRKYCKACGGHVYADHPLWNLVDVFAGAMPGFPFKAQVHLNYQETVLPMKDGLPKQRDFPKEVGGTGELIAE